MIFYSKIVIVLTIMFLFILLWLSARASLWYAVSKCILVFILVSRASIFVGLRFFVLFAFCSLQEDSSKTRKRPKSIDGNGNLVPPCAVKTEQTAAGAAAASPFAKTTASPPAVAEASAAAAAAKTSVSPPVTAGIAQAAASATNGTVNTSIANDNAVGTETGAARTTGSAAPMSGVVVGTLTMAGASAGAVAETATPDATACGGATPSLERSTEPPEFPPAPTQPPPVPEPSRPPSQPVTTTTTASAVDVPVAVADGDRRAGNPTVMSSASAAAAAVAEVPEQGGLVSSVNGGCDGTTSNTAGAPPTQSIPVPVPAAALAPSSSAPNGEVTIAPAATAARGRRNEQHEGAGGRAAAVAAVAEKAKVDRAGVNAKDAMEVDEDVGAEAAGDAASGSAAGDNFDVSVLKSFVAAVIYCCVDYFLFFSLFSLGALCWVYVVLLCATFVVPLLV